MLDTVIFAVALLLVVAVIMVIVGLASPGIVARIIPWVGRPAPSRKRVALMLGTVVAGLAVAQGVLLALPNFDVGLPDGSRVVAGEATGIRIGIKNSGITAGNYASVYSLDGIKQSDVAVRVPGGQTAEMNVPLPTSLTPGPHTVVVGDASFEVSALRPAAFSVTSLEPDLEMAKTGQRVTVSADVINTGEAPGEFGGELLVNGRRYDAQPVTIEPGSEESLQFTFRSHRQGKNRLRIGDASCSLVVVKPMHYANGHYLWRRASGGRGLLKVKNGNGVDGVVVITRSSARKVPAIACYVGARRSCTISGIPDGKYWIYYSLGRDWNTYTDGFLTTKKRGVFRSPCKFVTSTWTTSWSDSMYRYTQGHVQYSGWRITLHGVPGGNARTEDVAQNDFPRVH